MDTNKVDIDFQKIYDYITEHVEGELSVDDISEFFSDQAEFYIQELFGIDEIDEDYNYYVIEEIITAFGQWLEQTTALK